MIVANAHSAVNLLFNGSFELATDGIPTFWRVNNLVDGNAYTLNSGLNLILGSRATLSIIQDFTAGSLVAVNNPGENSRSRSQPAGNQMSGNRTLPANTNYTLAFDIQREVGDVEISAVILVSGTPAALIDPQVVTLSSNIRLTYHIPAHTTKIDSIEVQFRSTTGAELTINRVMLAAGSFESIPYTGDPFQQVFEPDAIIMSMGDSCPAGFVDLGDGDSGPLSEWGIEPGIRTRVENYPRGGSELTGSPVHASDDIAMRQGASDSLLFEGYEGRLYDEFTKDSGDPANGNYAFNSAKENSVTDGVAPHTHTISEEGTRPVSFGMKFCKRADKI